MSEDAPIAEPPRKRAMGLGRGLNALLGDVAREQPVAGDANGAGSGDVRLIAVADLSPHPGQPRKHFDDAALDELAASIRDRGVIQPIVARRTDRGYQIIAGERRWRAAQRAGIHQVPVLVRDFDDSATLEIALIENVQREDLNAIEEAEAYRRLIADFGHKPDTIGRLVNKSRSHVANLLRLLELPQVVRDHVAAGRLTMGHARALLGTGDAETLAAQIIDRDLSVRETERLAAAKKPARTRQASSSSSYGHDEDIAALEQQLGDLLGLRVVIQHKDVSGALTLHYRTLDQLDMICQRLSGESF